MAKPKTTKKGKKSGAKRKRPIQERSQRRLASILDAAAEAFADFGFDATTMEGIAATAGTSIGSVYQFFPNKRAVFREVAQKAIEHSGRTFATLMIPEPATRPWTELLDAAFDGYFTLHRSDPMMRAMVRNFELYREFEAEDTAQLERFTAVIAHLISVWTPKLPEAKRKRVARVLVVTFATSMLVLAREDEASAAEMLVETKLMLRRYLSGYIGDAEA